MKATDEKENKIDGGEASTSKEPSTSKEEPLPSTSTTFPAESSGLAESSAKDALFEVI